MLQFSSLDQSETVLSAEKATNTGGNTYKYESSGQTGGNKKRKSRRKRTNKKRGGNRNRRSRRACF
jgi:hypothetical protein